MAEPGEPLSERELAILERLAAGMTNREIALDLTISPNTVKVHVRNIFAKLGVSSRTEAATAAIQSGVLAIPGLEEEQAAAEADAEPVAGIDDKETAESSPAESLPAVPPSGEQPAEDATPAAAGRSWRFFAFVLILAAGLTIGALVTAWWLGDTSASGPDGQETPEQEPFVVEALGDSNWRTGRSLPTERADMAVASIGLDLYVIGGQVDAGVVNLVDVYETNSYQWQSAAAKPTAVSDASAAVLFGEIYVPGGQLSDGRPTAVVEAYSPANDAWRPVTPLPAPIAGGLTLSDGNQIYLLGGWDGEKYLDGGFAYDVATDSWQELPPMAHARANAAGDALGDRLFIIGGFDGQNELAVCEYFDVINGEWGACASMNQPRAGAGASAQGSGALYVIGGGLAGSVSDGERYDALDDSWSAIEMPMLDGGGSWRDLGVATVETNIYALGGRQGEDIVTDNYTFVPFMHRTYLPSIGSEG